MKKSYQKPISNRTKYIKFKDAIKQINPMDRIDFEQQFGHLKKIPEQIVREWLW